MKQETRATAIDNNVFRLKFIFDNLKIFKYRKIAYYNAQITCVLAMFSDKNKKKITGNPCKCFEKFA